MENNKKIFFFIIGVLILGVIVSVLFGRGESVPPGPGKYDAFTQCLADKGAVFYGAFWCSHCQTTKKLFGASAKLLPYVECSTLDGKGQLPVCREKNIEGYPTWEFADGSRLVGGVSMEQLAEKTSCVINPVASLPGPAVE